MTPQEIIENNILLATFCDLITENAEGQIKEDPNSLKFDKDWNWLMLVVDKIESLMYWVNRINGDVWIVDNNKKVVVNNTMHNDGIEATYNACVEFVRWYNQNNGGN